MSTITVDKGAPTRKVKYGSMSRDRAWALRWSYFFLTLFAIFSLVPPFYMLITSLKTSAEISAATNPWWVYHPTLSNYIGLLTSNQFLTFFRNSAFVSMFVVTITMLISVPAAFALSRMRFWGSATLATGVFLTYLIPDSLLFIPLFKMFAVIGDWTGIQLINRWYVLLFIYPTLTVPFCTWIMIGYFASIPKELDEAAIIDGAGPLRLFFGVVMPLLKPVIVTVVVVQSVAVFNDFQNPLYFLPGNEYPTVQLGLYNYQSVAVSQFNLLFMYILLVTIPPLIMYIIFNRQIVAGMTSGAIKG
jgi:multiple sugar transport system permease protein